MSEWGRKEDLSWPSRGPVLTWGAFFVALLFLFGGMAWQYAQEWSFAEREYLGNYMLASTMGRLRDQGHYRLLTYVDRKGSHYIAIGDEIERVKMADGQPGYRLTEAGIRAGAVRMEWQDSMFPNAWMRAKLKHAVYKDGTVWDYIEGPAYGALGILAVLLFFALPRDRKRALEFKHGRRLRGPELVTTAEFNRRFGQWRWLKRHLPDGLGIINVEQSWLERTFDHIWSRWVRIPRAVESHHMLLMGDTGSGKSAIIRQVLIQIAERGETAIVYDPALEYLPQFYDARRGDVILNPLDARCPYWTPGDEVPHPAEALTLAASLFPDQGRENRFFVESPRRIFAHLLNLKPTPEELTAWMSNPEEIDKRVRGTEMAAMIDPHAGPQRSGVLGSLGMIVDALRLLPREAETKQRWSTVAWARERKGWIFITSKPTMRERLRPLISLWLDLLVLRLMNEGEAGARKTWFVPGRVGEPATVTATLDSHHRKQKIEQSADPWLPRQGADRSALRTCLRGNALSASNQDISKNKRTECGGVDIQSYREHQDRTLPGDADTCAVPASARVGEPAARHYGGATDHGERDRRA